jgi:hypothetical protein
MLGSVSSTPKVSVNCIMEGSIYKSLTGRSGHQDEER